MHVATIPEIVQLLINAGADINVQNENGDTALHGAVEDGHEKKIKILVDNGADINVRNYEGQTPLHFASQEKVKLIHISIFLVNRGADINAKDNKGQTALHYAVVKYNPLIIRFLSKIGDINATTIYGSTPLHFAAVKGFEDIVKLLFDNGANIYIRDKNGKTAIKYAKSEDIINFIKEKGYESYVRNVKKSRAGTGIYIPILSKGEWEEQML